MRVEVLDLQAGISVPAIGPKELSYSYMLGTNGEVYIMGSNGRSYVVNSLEEAERLTGQSKSRSRAVGFNGLVDLTEVAKMLNVGRNKIKILQMLRRGDLMNILALLPKDLLINALRLFDKSKLLRMLFLLPKQFLLKMLLRIFKIEDLIKKMPTSELMRILRSKKLDNRQLTKGIQNNMEPKFVQLLLQRVFGDYDYSHLKPYELKQIFMQTPKEKLMEGFKTLPFKALIPFVTGFVKEDPSLLMNMSDGFMAKLFDRMSKPMILEGCQVLPNEMILKMLGQLPGPMMVLAAGQIDDKSFEKYLISQQPNLLKMLAGAA